MKNETGVSSEITLRIPGAWAHPRDLLERIPEGFQLSPDLLVLPDGTEIEFNPRKPDKQFASVFETACRRPPSADELAILARYSVIVCLTGPGGSLKSALAMMQAGAAIVEAGGAGVFIDNSAMAHGGSDWVAMTEDGGSDAISFAFTTIVRGPREVHTMGMGTMGFADLQMRATDVDPRGEKIVEIIRYLCGSDRQIDIGHLLADELGPRFQVVANESDAFEAGSIMHNPYGRLKIVSVKEIADGN
jgi:hypothetical protein